MTRENSNENLSFSPPSESLSRFFGRSGEALGLKVAFKTLGCRLNQYETDALVTDFDEAGYKLVDFDQSPDVVVINTCTVTNQSDQKSRTVISQAARKNKDAVVVVTGCMANNFKEKLESQDNITFVVENNRKSSILSLVDAHFSGEILHPEQLPQDVFRYEPVRKSLHTRSAVKVQDGCDNFCTFCIIPTVRGRAVSRPVADVLESVRKTIENGFKEIVVTGVNIGRYEDGESKFEDLLAQILDVPGDFRVRISSLEPDGFGDRFVELFSHPKLMPHLHLCLQSGSEKTLLRMRRMYDVEQFRKTINQFRSVYPDFNFTTDIIVGFPGETDEEFQQTLDAVAEFNFSHVHTFKYSVRKGTRAERMENHIPEKIKTARSAQIRELSEENKLRYYQSLIGKTQNILVEKATKTKASGYGDLFVPVEFEAKDVQKNTIHTVKLTGLSGEGEKLVVVGELI
ncbi:MAG: tRNA (N(6)-L-threonylcarbamoyladenosine(37)-C(2))-methylthiotransferase MtaB [Bacteroidota bacterium]|nr:tRNA (N(6)-L-threonylcarbamoyladenosine(37)-C(2))-methylthiotransferase MtaB [Bacteroidota bacterium]MDP3433545.1 tRNA (N(6)-L-threonylcarbamoyladenosine(37)-C(2))-methylthiotransferase MtaB [Bacteroidota bacterium]